MKSYGEEGKNRANQDSSRKQEGARDGVSVLSDGGPPLRNELSSPTQQELGNLRCTSTSAYVLQHKRPGRNICNLVSDFLQREALAWTWAAVIGLSAAVQQAVRYFEMLHPGTPSTSHPLLICPAPRGAVGYKGIQWREKRSPCTVLEVMNQQ